MIKCWEVTIFCDILPHLCCIKYKYYVTLVHLVKDIKDMIEKEELVAYTAAHHRGFTEVFCLYISLLYLFIYNWLF